MTAKQSSVEFSNKSRLVQLNHCHPFLIWLLPYPAQDFIDDLMAGAIVQKLGEDRIFLNAHEAMITLGGD